MITLEQAAKTMEEAVEAFLHMESLNRNIAQDCHFILNPEKEREYEFKANMAAMGGEAAQTMLADIRKILP